MVPTPAPTARTSLTVRRTINAPREKVFRAWTTPEEIARWAAPNPLVTTLTEVDLRVGGRFRTHMRTPEGLEHRTVGVYKTIDPPRKLVYTWRWEDDPHMTDDTIVTVEFHQQGDATEIVLTHDLFPNDQLRQAHLEGWTACLENVAGMF